MRTDQLPQLPIPAGYTATAGGRLMKTPPAKPKAPKIDAVLKAAQTMAPPLVGIATGVTPPVEPSLPAVPDMPAPTPTPEVQPVVAPVDVRRLDGPGRLTDLMGQAFAIKPDDDVTTISYKIRKKSEMTQKLPALGTSFDAQTAEAIFNEWYPTVADVPQPTASFSPEERQLLEQAYGGALPTARAVGPQDLDKSQLGMAAGLLLAGLFRGDASAALPALTQVMQDARGKADLANQNAVAGDEMKRKKALAMYQRLASLDDYNNTQAGYEARDNRMAEREAAKDQATAVRQRDDDARTLRQKMATMYFGFLQSGESARAAQAKAFYESETGRKVDDSFNEIAPTAKEGLTVAQTEHTEADTDRIERVITGLDLKNELDKKIMKDVARNWKNKADLGDEQIKKIRIEVEKLPKWWDERTKKLSVDAAAAKIRAEAALARAQNAGNKKGADPNKDRISELAKIATTFNSAIDNKRDKLRRALDEVKRVDEDIRRDNLLYGGGNAKVLGQRLKDAQSAAASIGAEIDNDIKVVDKANDQLNQLVIGGK